MTLPDVHTGPSDEDVRVVASGRFRKRPTEVTASRWWANGDHPQDGVGGNVTDTANESTLQRLEGEIVRFYRHPDVSGKRVCAHCDRTMHEHGWIDTLEGGHIVCPGDWIVTGVRGELYPVKADIFELTYEPVVG